MQKMNVRGAKIQNIRGIRHVIFFLFVGTFMVLPLIFAATMIIKSEEIMNLSRRCSCTLERRNHG